MSKNPPRGRREAIASRLANGLALVAVELASEFDVSGDAIRRDLRALASKAAAARRVYGGRLATFAGEHASLDCLRVTGTRAVHRPRLSLDGRSNR